MNLLQRSAWLQAAKCLALALLLYASWLLWQLTVPYLDGNLYVDFLRSKQAILHNKVWLTAFYIHITSSGLVILAGALQFSRRVLREAPQVHRWAGRLYVATILILAAPSGLVLGWLANGGLPAQASFVLVALLWWLFTWDAWRHIRAGRVNRHRAAMARSYALSLSAVSLRLLAILIPTISHALEAHHPGRDVYITMAWLSWVPNLLVADWLARQRGWIA